MIIDSEEKLLEELRARRRKLLALKQEWRPEWKHRRTRRRDRPRCGAKTRSGAPCNAPCVWDHEKDRPRNGRCKLHGGLSRGPTTPEGRQRAIAAMQEGNRRWRERQG
jgi:hypothetical protein